MGIQKTPLTADAAVWTRPLAQILQELEATPQGLSSTDADLRRLRFGFNHALQRRGPHLWRQILARFGNPLIMLLLFAGALSAWTGQLASCVIITVITSLSVALDMVQQSRAENAVEALRQSVGLRAQVIRDSQEQTVPVELLVPGDVVHLIAGDIVPADCRLLSARDLFVNQALLTGEAYPVEKRAVDLAAADVAATDAENVLFMGTSVISGTCVAIVCRTGQDTAVGALAGSLASRRPDDAFETGIRRFGLLMLRFTFFLVVFVLAANVLFERPWLDSLLFALALAVGLTPELLPMIVTVTLANGAQRLARRRVIVKRLAAIHDLGAMDVLCTDKTGTLTESRIRLVKHVDGFGAASMQVAHLAVLNAGFESGIRSPMDDAVLACGKEDLAGWTKIDEVPFDFERRRVSVLLDNGQQRLLVVKGAPEEMIAISSQMINEDGQTTVLEPARREALHRRFETLGEEGYRVLGVASCVTDRNRESAAVGQDTPLVFAGFSVFIDPPKADAGAAIAALAGAGVTVKVLTGDSEQVTRHVCAEIGLEVGGVLTGQEIAALSAEALRARVGNVNLFCRVSPQQKERILLALKHRGNVVGFLGDGINDASALHAADVGISVNSAADVAKAAADLVLLEPDLSVVHDGVVEGRATVANVSKYILMGASSNLGNMFSMAGAALFLPFLPMLPTQVLLNNLLYDLSEIGVPFDTVDPEAVERPSHWDIGSIERFMLVLGPLSSIFDFLTFYALLKWFGLGEAAFQTGWFLESLVTQSLVVLVIRTRGRPWQNLPHPLLVLLSVGAVLTGVSIVFSPLGSVFGFVPLPPAFTIYLVGATLAYLVVIDFAKRIYFRRAGKS